MDSRRRKKKKQINALKYNITRKNYMSLSTDKRLMRFLKETGYFSDFIKRVMQKHKIGFQKSINLIKSNPDISFLINTNSANWTNGRFGGHSFSFTLLDEATRFYDMKFFEYRPKC